MNLGRKTNAFIVGLMCCGLLMQTTPSIAGPPARADSKSAKVKPNDSPSVANQAPARAEPKSAKVKPNDVPSAVDESPAPKKVVQPTAIDVAMAKDGSLSGRVLNADQKGVAKSTVSIRQGKTEVAQAVTDAEGRFEVANLKGGVYIIAASSGYGMFRLWTAKSAPPKSHDQVLLMSNAIVVRAQNPDDSGEVLYDENGQPYAQVHVVDNGEIATVEYGPPVGSGGLSGLDIFTIALLGTAAAGLVIAIIALDDDDPASP
ncbi:MAG: carboxypeptidase regulatory-like domain-containing protein [Planctomycetaceae bacterium]